ncbi:MAG: hypothetical protein E7467_08850 [Ruminococcaceae bacterium]|nr:hypothetical protein [Oscillospiraceae bacterium]
MIILNMKASFGKLNGELTLKEGMNLLCLPNEAGKSTWSAFLLAMLYGIDTKEKPSEANDRLPVKERYKPWDGRPMEGRIELLHEGRRITIERSTKGRVPMGQFAAYDTDTGTPITELTAENCGKLLCGVEKSVFERTAFIRQLGLDVTEDAALENRMNALVTTGEEGMSAGQIEAVLRDMKNKLSRPSTGQINRIQTQIMQTRRELEDLHQLQEESLQLRVQSEQAQAELERLTQMTERIERAQMAKKQMAVQEMALRNQMQENLCRRLQEQCAMLPKEETLHALKTRLEVADSRYQTAQMEEAFSPEAPSRPQPPTCFYGMDARQALRKQVEDAARYAELKKRPAPNKLPTILCAILVLLGVAVCFVSLYIGLVAAAGALVALIACAVIYSRQKSKKDEAERQAERILTRYGVEDMDESKQLAQAHAQQMHSYELACENHKREMNERKACVAAAKQQLGTILNEVRAFAPSCDDARQAMEAIRAAVQLHTQNFAEQRTLELGRAQLASMQSIVGRQSDLQIDEEALQLDEAKLQYEKNAARERLERCRIKLSEQQGRISATADASVLHARIEQLNTQLEQARQTEEILTIATEALREADETLRSRFSPQITAETGRILSELTQGKYAQVQLKADMELSVREKDAVLTRPAAAMSCGTADQMYLALRLAMVRRLLNAAVPIVLDDALVNFDDARTREAIRVLTEEAKKRQIILFTCKEVPDVY